MPLNLLLRLFHLEAESKPMDKIVFTDVTKLIEETKPIVRECFSNDAYVGHYMNMNLGSNFFFNFYNWAFRFSLYKFYGVRVADLDTNKPHYSNVFNAIEPSFGNLYRVEMNHHDVQAVTLNPIVQVAFNGKYLFIMPCHAIN